MPHPVFHRLQQAGKLPSPVGVVLEILRLADAPDASVAELAEVVQRDPALSGRLLQAVNSAFTGVPRRVASVTRAAAMLGVVGVKTLSLGFSLVDRNRVGPCQNFDYLGYWSRCMGRAAAMMHLARRTGGIAADEAFSVGMLSRVGQIGLATAFPDSYGSTLELAQSDASEPLAKFEADLYDITHVQLTAEMLRDWTLPDIFVEAILIQDAPERDSEVAEPRVALCARLLRLADLLAEVLQRQDATSEEASAVLRAGMPFDIDPGMMQIIFDAIGSTWQSMCGVFQLESRNVLSLAEIYARAAERRRLMASARV